MYAYVRNNPLAHVDPNGKACSGLLGNTGSGFCQRATEYGALDAQVSGKTRFFAAAAAVSVELADVDVGPTGFFSRAVVSTSTQSFLSGLGQDLEKMNVGIAQSIQSGSLDGPGLDAKIVHMEQTRVQQSLDTLQKTDSAAYGKVINDSNSLLNPTGLIEKAASAFPTDKAYAQVLGAVRKDLGRNIDFSKQSDREAIGNKLIQHIRQTGGCDVAGDKIKGCK